MIKAGYQVVVWNRNPAKCQQLVGAGAKVRGRGALHLWV